MKLMITSWARAAIESKPIPLQSIAADAMITSPNTMVKCRPIMLRSDRDGEWQRIITREIAAGKVILDAHWSNATQKMTRKAIEILDLPAAKKIQYLPRAYFPASDIAGKGPHGLLSNRTVMNVTATGKRTIFTLDQIEDLIPFAEWCKMDSLI